LHGKRKSGHRAVGVFEVLRLIRTAILEKHALRVVYDGLERVLCPQMLGRNKNRQVRILCLQVGVARVRAVCAIKTVRVIGDAWLWTKSVV
jgi:hypothetical protein